MEDRKRIAVAGAGYVGLAMAALLSRGHEVVLVDVVPDKVAAVNRLESPIADPDIESLFKSSASGAQTLHLRATLDMQDAYKHADIVIIATPTNYDSETDFFDTSSVESAIAAVRDVNSDAWVVIKSTVPVGYTKSIRADLNDERIVFSPEFLREGKALYDNLHPSRIVVGADLNNEKSVRFAQEFAAMLTAEASEGGVPQLVCGSTEAEAIKLFANTYLALRVSYFNELDTYAAVKGLDSRQIIDGVCLDPRIGQHYNNPSFGYGGYCLPKDTKQLLANYGNVPQDLIEAVVSANTTRKAFVVQEIEELVKAIANPIIGIYRLTMKTGSDNFRQSSIQDIIMGLTKKGYDVLIYEPSLNTNSFLDCEVTVDLQDMKNRSGIIVANRLSEDLGDVSERVYTRDIFSRD